MGTFAGGHACMQQLPARQSREIWLCTHALVRSTWAELSCNAALRHSAAKPTWPPTGTAYGWPGTPVVSFQWERGSDGHSSDRVRKPRTRETNRACHTQWAICGSRIDRSSCRSCRSRRDESCLGHPNKNHRGWQCAFHRRRRCAHHLLHARWADTPVPKLQSLHR